MSNRTMLLGGMVALVGCAANPGAELSESETARIAAEVETRIDEYPDALKRRDVEWYHAFWGDFDGFVVAGDGELVSSPEVWAAQVRQGVEGVQELLDFEFLDRHTYVLARDAAVHSTRFRWAVVTTTGDTLRSHGSWSYVMKNFDGLWRVVHSAGTHVEG